MSCVDTPSGKGRVVDSGSGTRGQRGWSFNNSLIFLKFKAVTEERDPCRLD